MTLCANISAIPRGKNTTNLKTHMTVEASLRQRSRRPGPPTSPEVARPFFEKIKAFELQSVTRHCAGVVSCQSLVKAACYESLLNVAEHILICRIFVAKKGSTVLHVTHAKSRPSTPGPSEPFSRTTSSILLHYVSLSTIRSFLWLCRCSFSRRYCIYL